MRVRLRRWLVGGALLAAGCSSARYDADYAKQVETYRAEAPFAYLNRTPEAVRDILQLRLPKDFAAVPTRQLVEKSDGSGGKEEQPVDPSRRRPQFLGDLSGLLESFERVVKVDAKEYFATITIWMQGGGEEQRRRIQGQILQAVGEAHAFGAGELAWEKRDFEAVAGGPQSWRVLSLRGAQVCEYNDGPNPMHEPVKGHCEVWCSDGEPLDQTVILVWWCPDEAAGALETPLSVLAELVARTVSLSSEEADESEAGAKKANPDAAGQKPLPAADTPEDKPSEGF
jgi:hypothetical protein